MSLSRREPHSSRQSRRHQSSQSCLPWRTTQLAAALSQVCRDRAATSLAYRSSRPILLASASNCSARLSHLRRLAIMAHVGNPGAVLELAEVRAAARVLGLEVATLEIRRAEDIAPAFEALNGRVEAL